MPRLVCCPLLLLALLAMPALAAKPQSLFDGQSLQGWEGNEKIFRVENGAIVAGTLAENIPHNEFLCTTRAYENFELKLEAKLVGPGQNAGVQFRTKRIPNHHEVSGYQCDMGRAGEDLIWGALYDESRRNKFLAQGDQAKLKAAFRDGQWNQLTIRCEAGRIQIWVNDYQTVDYTETDPNIPTTGIIALQIHGGPPAIASYKNITLRKLD